MINQNTSTGGTSFSNLGIAPKLLEILERNKFVTPTPIQEQSIPAALTGSDLMGIAQTGTGKTLAFGIPMIQRLAQGKGGIGLVVLPTRELALQVNETLKKIGTSIGLKTAILIGGENIGRQLVALKRNPHIIIATPGRLIDHLDKKSVELSKTAVLVLDEADRMLDMGFAPQINKILEKVPKTRQTLLFSATMPPEIVKIANSYMKTPLRIEVAPAGSAVKSVTQEIYFLERGEKLALLKELLTKFNGSVLVFSRTKYGAKKIARDVRNMGVPASEIHSNRSLNQRLEALKGFKLGTYRVLVATDIAARGIDVTGIQLVINYDLPDQAEDYVHRIGRTGRASMTGHAISFATHDQRRDVKTIEKLIRTSLPVATLPKLERVASVVMPGDRRESGDRGARGGRPTSGGRSFGGRPGSSRPSSARPSGNRRSDTRPAYGARPTSAPYNSQSSSPRGPMVPGSRGPARPSNGRPTSSGSGNVGPKGRGKNKKWSDYERGRKAPPQSLKKISPSSNGFFISRKAYSDDE